MRFVLAAGRTDNGFCPRKRQSAKTEHRHSTANPETQCPARDGSIRSILCGASFINAGRAGDAWSGGDVWNDPSLIAEITRFVA